MNDNLHQLRCFGCGARISGAEAQPDFRCVHCGDLFEVEYPGWSERGGHDRPNPGALKWLWRERRCSSEALDRSGAVSYTHLDVYKRQLKNSVGHCAHQLANLCRGEHSFAILHRRRGDGLIHDGERVAHRAVTRLGQQGQRGDVYKRQVLTGSEEAAVCR